MVYRKRLTSQITGGVSLAPARQAISQSFGQLQQLNQQFSDSVLKARQTKMNDALSLSTAGLRNSYNLYNSDPEEFSKTVNDVRKEYLNSFDNDEQKEYFLARFDIALQPYNSKVAQNYEREEQKKNTQSKREIIDSSINSFNDNASLFLTKGEGYEDLKRQLNSLYENKDIKDDNGNYIYTNKQKKDIENIYKSKALYGTQAFVNDNLYTNTQAIIDKRSEMLDNPAEFMKNNDMSSDDFNKAIKFIDNSLDVSEKNKNSANEELDNEKGLNLLSRYEQFDISKGIVRNEDLDSIADIVSYRNDLKNNKHTLKESTYNRMIANTKNVLYRMAQDNYGEKAERRTYWFKKDEEFNVGNSVIPNIDYRIPQENDTTNSLRADLYEKTVTNLINSGISLDSIEPEIIEKGKAIANRTYINHMKNIYPDASSYSDEQLLRPDTFKQLEYDRKRKILYPDQPITQKKDKTADTEQESIFNELGL